MQSILQQVLVDSTSVQSSGLGIADPLRKASPPTYTSACEETNEKKTSISVPCYAMMIHDVPCVSVLARRKSKSNELIAFQLI